MMLSQGMLILYSIYGKVYMSSFLYAFYKHISGNI